MINQDDDIKENKKLTQKRLKELLEYNPETGIFIRKIASTNSVKVGDKAGYKQNSGYIQITIDGKKYSGNKLAWLYCYGYFPLGNLYHIDQIRDNNRIKNLQEATQKEDGEITQTRLKELLKYDSETGIFVWKVARQNIIKAEDKAGSKNSDGYIQICVDGKIYLAHRLAWLFIYGCFPLGNLYHINGIQDNNWIKNLREVSQKEDGEITQTRLKELLKYDSETGIFVWKVARQNIIKAEDKAGNKNSDGYIYITIDGKSYRLHRLAWLYYYGYFPKGDLDHKDRIRDNNRIKNLREVTKSQNVINSKTYSTNTSGVKGVFYHKQHQKWVVRIGILGKQTSLGYYENIFDAAKARFKAEIKYGYTDILSMASSSHIYILSHGTEEDLLECYFQDEGLTCLEEVNFERYCQNMKENK